MRVSRPLSAVLCLCLFALAAGAPSISAPNQTPTEDGTQICKCKCMGPNGQLLATKLIGSTGKPYNGTRSTCQGLNGTECKRQSDGAVGTSGSCDLIIYARPSRAPRATQPSSATPG